MKSASIMSSFATLLLALAWLGLTVGCAMTPLAPQDKAVLVTAADLESIGATLPAAFTEFERNSKTRRIDGGVELEYHFDARTAGRGYPDIYTTINQETTVSSAVAAYGAVKAGLSAVRVEARDDSGYFRYGDWSYFGTLLVGGEAQGFVFYMRDSLTVYTLMISGTPMDVDIMWKQLLLPRLEMLSRTGS
jgi:hypothetical protein